MAPRLQPLVTTSPESLNVPVAQSDQVRLHHCGSCRSVRSLRTAETRGDRSCAVRLDQLRVRGIIGAKDGARQEE